MKNFSGLPVIIPSLETFGDGDCFLRSLLQHKVLSGYQKQNESHFQYIFSNSFIRDVENEYNVTYENVDFDINNESEESTNESPHKFLKVLRKAIVDKARHFYTDTGLMLEDESEWEEAKKDHTHDLFDLIVPFMSHILKRHFLIFDEKNKKIIPQSGNSLVPAGTLNVTNDEPILLARILIGQERPGFQQDAHYQILLSSDTNFWHSYALTKCRLLQQISPSQARDKIILV